MQGDQKVTDSGFIQANTTPLINVHVVTGIILQPLPQTWLKMGSNHPVGLNETKTGPEPPLETALQKKPKQIRPKN